MRKQVFGAIVAEMLLLRQQIAKMPPHYLVVGIILTQRLSPAVIIDTKHITGSPNIHLKGKWLKEAGFETDTHLTVKISDGCIVLIKDSDEVDELKHEKEALHQQLRDIKQAHRNMKSAAKAALRGMTV